MHVMSEHQPGSRETYEERRDRVLRQLEDGDIDDAAALRIMRAGLPWKDWLIHDFLRYWFIVCALGADLLTVLWIVGSLDASDLVVGLVAAVAFLAMGAVEVLIYLRVWPEGPFTKRRRSRKHLRKLLEE